MLALTSQTTVKVCHYLISHTVYFKISVFSPNAGKYGPEITPYLDTFHAVSISVNITDLEILEKWSTFIFDGSFE